MELEPRRRAAVRAAVVLVLMSAGLVLAFVLLLVLNLVVDAVLDPGRVHPIPTATRTLRPRRPVCGWGWPRPSWFSTHLRCVPGYLTW